MFTLKKEKIETFDFKVEGDKATYKIPLLRHLPMDMALQAKDLADADDDEALEFVKDIFDSYAPGVVGGLTANEFTELTSGYFEASGVSLGE